MEAGMAVRRWEEAGERFYEIEGRRLPSVTTVLQVIARPGLYHWGMSTAMARMRDALMEASAPADMAEWADWVEAVIASAKAEPERVRDEAADYGLTAHDIIARWLAGEAVEVPPAQEAVWAGFRAWWEQAGLEPVEMEKVVHRFYGDGGWAGTLDLLAKDKQGNPVIVDWKTSNRLHPEYALQVGGYALALQYMTASPGKPLMEPRGLVVRFAKAQPGWEVAEVNMPLACYGFWSAYELWRVLRGGRVWRG